MRDDPRWTRTNESREHCQTVLPGSFHDVVAALSVRSPAGSGVCLTPPSEGPAPGRDIEQGVSDGIFGPAFIL